jgi:hypothetical protein
MVFQKKNESNEEESNPSSVNKELEGDAELVEVPTQTTMAFKIKDDVFDERVLLLKIYNDIQKIKKGIL